MPQSLSAASYELQKRELRNLSCPRRNPVQTNLFPIQKVGQLEYWSPPRPTGLSSFCNMPIYRVFSRQSQCENAAHQLMDILTRSLTQTLFVACFSYRLAGTCPTCQGSFVEIWNREAVPLQNLDSLQISTGDLHTHSWIGIVETLQWTYMVLIESPIPGKYYFHTSPTLEEFRFQLFCARPKLLLKVLLLTCIPQELNIFQFFLHLTIFDVFCTKLGLITLYLAQNSIKLYNLYGNAQNSMWRN